MKGRGFEAEAMEIEARSWRDGAIEEGAKERKQERRRQEGQRQEAPLAAVSSNGLGRSSCLCRWSSKSFCLEGPCPSPQPSESSWSREENKDHQTMMVDPMFMTVQSLR